MCNSPLTDSGRIFKKLQKVLPVSFVFLSSKLLPIHINFCFIDIIILFSLPVYIVDILLNMVARPSYFKKFWYMYVYLASLK